VRGKQYHNQGLFTRIQVEYCAVLSEQGPLVYMTWTTGFQFPVRMGIFFHNLYRTGYRVTYFLSNVLQGLFSEGWCDRSWSWPFTL